MRRITNILALNDRLMPLGIIGLLIACLISCNVHEFPEDSGSHPIEEPEELSISLTIDLQIETFFVHDSIFMSRAATEGRQRRYLIDIYKENEVNNQPFKSLVLYQNSNDNSALTTKLSLPTEKYRIAVWQDYVYDGRESPFYEINSTAFIHLPAAEYYKGDTEDKLCASKCFDLDLTPYRGMTNYHVECKESLTSPLARIEFVTTDLNKFASRVAARASKSNTRTSLQSLTAKIVYPAYLPSGFNVLINKPNDSSMGYSCDTKIVQTSPNKARVGFDYILINSHESYVDAQLVIYDEDNTEISHSQMLHIPIKRGGTTYIYDEFLTKSAGSSVSINHKFEGEFNIYI